MNVDVSFSVYGKRLHTSYCRLKACVSSALKGCHRRLTDYQLVLLYELVPLLLSGCVEFLHTEDSIEAFYPSIV